MRHSEPQETDPAQAFEGVRRELSLLHRAIEGLAAARDNLPDYSETLGGMDQALKRMAGQLAEIGQSPAMKLTPSTVAQEINKAAQVARAEDRKALIEAVTLLSRSLGHIDALVTRKRGTNLQNRLLLWVGTSAFLFGILLWSILPGVIARTLPESWHVPEWVAARVMRLDQKEAGQRMIDTAP